MGFFITSLIKEIKNQFIEGAIANEAEEDDDNDDENEAEHVEKNQDEEPENLEQDQRRAQSTASCDESSSLNSEEAELLLKYIQSDSDKFPLKEANATSVPQVPIIINSILKAPNSMPNPTMATPNCITSHENLMPNHMPNPQNSKPPLVVKTILKPILKPVINSGPYQIQPPKIPLIIKRR